VPTPKPKAQTTKPKPTAAPEFGGTLAFQTTIGGEFYTINADGSNLQRITDGVDPVWSPDGQRIAFTRWREPRGVWVVDVVDGPSVGEWRVFDWSEARWPSWSPDGDEIMFSRQHGGRPAGERCFWGFCFEVPARPHWNVGVVRQEDGSFYEPPAPNLVLAPEWSPNGGQMVYDGEHGLMVQTLDGEVSYQITDDARDTGPVWSPDGSRIAFTRRQHDHWEVYMVDADGRNLTRLTKTPAHPDGSPANSAAPAWSPDGKHLAFLSDRTGEWEMWVMDANGSDQKPMFGSELDHLVLEYSSVAERAISWTK
jgi:TolB protein